MPAVGGTRGPTSASGASSSMSAWWVYGAVVIARWTTLTGSGRVHAHEAMAGRAGLDDAVEPEGPPVPPALVPGHQVPAPAGAHDAQRLQPPLRLVPARIAVADVEQQALAGRPAHRAQDGGGDDLRVLARAHQPRRRRREGGHLVAGAGGEQLLQADEEPFGGGRAPDGRAPSGGAEARGEDHRLLVVQDERRHVAAAAAEPVAAHPPGVGIHRVAELAQPLDVPPDRSHGDAEVVGQLRAGPRTATLQRRQQPEEALGGTGHRSQSAPNEG